MRLLLPLALLALVFGLAACGGDGDAEEDKIVEVIETSTSSTNPANCKELATQAFLEQTEAAQGQEAVKSCEDSAKDSSDDPDSVEVSEVEVDGSTATANVAFTGGNFDGQTVSVALVEEEGGWKLDEITGFAEFDQELLATSLEEALEEEETFDPQVVDCASKSIRQLPRSESEQLVIGGSVVPLVEIIEGCASDQ